MDFLNLYGENMKLDYKSLLIGIIIGICSTLFMSIMLNDVSIDIQIGEKVEDVDWNILLNDNMVKYSLITDDLINPLDIVQLVNIILNS